MPRAFLLSLLILCFDASAHLNHIQFAAVDEIDGKCRVRLRMSADMFLSNLDADIKSGRATESVKQQPLDQIIRAYFKSHLILDAGGTLREAESATFEFDAKSADWVADFWFARLAPDVTATLMCDAFLENNPRTQTLARINWRGENTMFHFRAGHTRYVLGSSIQAGPSDPVATQSLTEQFFDGAARGLKAYDFLLAGALVFIVLGQMFKTQRNWIVPALAVASSVLLALDQCPRTNPAVTAGFALSWLAVALTPFGVSQLVTSRV